MQPANSRRFRSLVGFALFAQSAESGSGTRWLMIGGALTVLAMGVAMVILVRWRRRDDYDARVAVRVDAAIATDPDPTPEPKVVRPKRQPTSTFIDLSADPDSARQTVPPATESPSVGRTSPLSSYDAEQGTHKRETFIDLPGRGRDPVIDLTDDSVDLTEEREEAGPARDPWTG